MKITQKYPPSKKMTIELLALNFLVIALATISCFFIYINKLNGQPIRSDGAGYYAYLPSIFVDHDLNFQTPIQNKASVGIRIYPGTGRLLNPYTVGTAILELPFFLAAKTIAPILKADSTGYSYIFQYSIIAGAICYLSIGISIIYMQLRKSNDVFVSSASTILAIFGTSTFHYATYDASFSHIYSFAIFSIFLYYLLQYHNDQSKMYSSRNSLILGLIVGMIGLIRFPNLSAAIIIAFLFISSYIKYRNISTLIKESTIFILAATPVIFIQLIYWKIATGHFIVNSYQDEKFNWGRPELINFLFSIRKGLLFWSPSLFLGFFGLILLYKNDNALGLSISTFILINIYVCSSWDCWWFGGSFGCRPFVDVIPLLAIPIALSTKCIADRFNYFTVTCLYATLIILNCTLMYSYWIGLLPFDEATTETFKIIFRHFFGSVLSTNPAAISV
ncbi:MAG: hypothetical protein ABSF52_08725 [Syntrophobacteraceae bacterium]|jgi:hypothetical protein